jgi:hypothetical protein
MSSSARRPKNGESRENTNKVVPALVPASQIKRKLREHLKELGFVRGSDGELVLPDDSKEHYRALHIQHWTQRLDSSVSLVNRCWPRFIRYFASGRDVRPERIKPHLEVVHKKTWQSDLFRLASLTWSIPVSNGYGRRIRFLVWDESNEKLLGLIALTDPVFNLSARDSEIGWNADDRRRRLIHMMDAHVLGALPPYNQLLCGKLLACLVRSVEVRDLFRAKYGASEGIISCEKKNAQLLAITTSSSLGRSSVYNRLKLNGDSYFRSIGFTSGYGHFHIPQSLFEEMRRYLSETNHPYSDGHRFGMGPNWRLRTIRACLDSLGLSEEILCHNLKREVFLSTLARNAKEIFCGRQIRPNWHSLLNIDAITGLAIERWILPRSLRRPEYCHWSPESLLTLIKHRPPASTEETEYAADGRCL